MHLTASSHRPTTEPNGGTIGLPPSYRWWVIVMLWFVCFFNYADRQAIYSVFPVLKDEFGFDKIERAESSQAANLLYKIIDARGQQHSTALVTNIGFEAWGEYLGDAPLAMAFLDRLVDGAIILKIKGKSYRAHRAKQPTKSPKAADQ
jgi:hypothetical protein